MSVRSFCVLVLIFIRVYALQSQPQEIVRIADRFSEGISDPSINSILEDSYGFIWLATRDGLSRFDGEFHNYYSSFEDPNSLSNSYILHIFEDSKNNIWVGTYGGGLYIYDRKKDQFEQLTQSISDSIRLHENHHFIIEDQEGQIWTATGNGVFVINPDTRQVERHFLDGQLFGELMEDHAGNIWIGGKNLFVYDKYLKKMISTHDKVYFENPFEERIIQDIIQDEDNRIWLICRDIGLTEIRKNASNKYYFKKEKFESPILNRITSNIMTAIPDGPWIWLGTENDGVYRYKKPSEGKTAELIKVEATRDNTYWSMIKDSSGRIWLGTYGKGIEIIDPLAHEFVYVPITDSNEEELAVEGIVVDQNNNLVLATGGEGIMKLNDQYGIMATISTKSNSGLKNDNLTSIYQGPDQRFYIGTWEGGLSIYDGNQIKTYRHDEQNKNSLIENEVTAVAFDPVQPDVIWIGTWYGGVDRLDLTKNKFSNLSSIANDSTPYLSSKDVTDLTFDTDHNLWVATSNGLNKIEFDNKRQVLGIKKYHQAKAGGLSANYLSFLFLDLAGKLWIGTHSEGLNLYNPSEDNFIRYSQNEHRFNGLAAMTEDRAGNYWISSNGGISKFSPQQEPLWQNFDKTHGLQSKNFRLGSVGQFTDGRIVFGAQNGIQIFDPKNITSNPIGPRVHLVSFKLFNQLINHKDTTQTILTQSFLTTDSLTLNYDQNNFSIQYTALGYTKPEHNTFAYQLDGIDPEWKYVGTNKSANYTSIPSGEYTFKVKACNSDGIWSEHERVLHISVGYAWWNTILFRLSLIVGTFIAGAYFIYNRERAHKKNKALLESKVKARTIQIEEQQKVIEQRAIDLAEKNQHISKQHEELQTYVEALNEINDQLERRVEIRTAKLLEINNRLSKVAFMNSHELRKPLSNILGLINLIDHLEDDEKRDICIKNLKVQAKEMDEKVRVMQESLYDYKQAKEE